MKKLYIIALCALVGASAAMAAPRFKSIRKQPRKVARTEAATHWCAGKIVTELYEEGEWIEQGTETFTYDKYGVTTGVEFVGTEGEHERTVYTNDDLGQHLTSLTTAEEDGEWTNVQKRSWAYDPIVRNFCTERMGYDWSDGEWVTNYLCEINEVTRNTAGNITRIEKSLPMMSQMLPAYRYEWSYADATGRATEFCSYSRGLSDNTWTLDGDVSYRNLEWAATDGQMTGTSLTDCLTGPNRIAKASVYYRDAYDGGVLVEYTDIADEFTLTETFADGKPGKITKREALDNHGSFRITETEYFTEGDDEVLPSETLTYQAVLEELCDAHGNYISQALYERYSEEDDLALFDCIKMEYTYDANGNLTQRTSYIMDPEAEPETDATPDTVAYVPEMRETMSDYRQYESGIDDIATDGATVAVYNLQGICVLRDATAADISSLPAGLYIAGGRKIAVK